MKVLIVDYWGTDGMLDIVMRAQRDGHTVRWAFKRGDRNSEIGKGLTTRVADWREHTRWADIIILADNTKYLREIDALRKGSAGAKVVGATVESAAWELDRKTGQETFKRGGIAVPPYREFSDYDAAIAYVKRENRAFVSKPSYDEPDKSLSYVAKSPADLVYMLERWKKANKLKGAFILQEKISGCEMAVGAFVGPHGFNSGWCENWEFKSLMAGDRGPNVGEMGTVVRFVSKSKLADKVLKPLEDKIVRSGHTGYVDVNCIIDEDGDPWPLEFTMRFGWPTFNIQQALVEGDCIEWLASLLDGRDSKPFAHNKIATGVVMALPEFPYGKTPMENILGVPVYNVNPDRPHDRIHPIGLMKGEAWQNDPDGQMQKKPTLLAAGDYLLVASGTGETVRQARGSAYRTLEKIQAPASPFWRPDIGQRLKAQLPEIQAQGYATGMNF
jgi:phosphoribosylamine--glycine ligase